MTSLPAAESFLGYYQFSHDPFTPRVPGFKFFPAQRKPVLAQLHHLARYSQLLLLVSGPKGSGKTLLRQALVASTNKQAVHSVVLSGRETSSAAAVLKLVGTALEASSASIEDILSQAGQLLLTGQEVYLLVDDAEQLDDSALEALLTLANGNAASRLHVFLFAEPQLVQRLSLLCPGEARFHAVELQPYSEQEVVEYLAQRLQGAGQALDVLTEGQIKEIYLQSGGWPGSINQVAKDVLMEAMLADQDPDNHGGFFLNLPRKHLVAMLLVGFVVVAAWFMRDQEESKPTSGSLQVEAPSTSGAGIEVGGQPIIREPLAQASGEAETEDPSANPIIADEVFAQIETGVPDTPASVALPLPELPPATRIVVPPEPPITKPEPVSQARPAAVSSAPKHAAVSQVQVKAVSVAPAGAAWYRSQPGSKVTLQILATTSESKAKSFVQQNGSDYHYFMKRHQGKTLYVVTYGVFSSADAAKAAVKKLPSATQAGKPWPKTFASIQSEMSMGR